VNGLGDGSTRIDLRGLRAAAHVTLLNGRRLPNGGIGADSSVDIDSLPLSMIERVEVLDDRRLLPVLRRRCDRWRRQRHHALALSEVSSWACSAQKRLAAMARSRARKRSSAATSDKDTGWSALTTSIKQGVSMATREYSAVPLECQQLTALARHRLAPSSLNGRFEVPDGNALGMSPGIYTRVPGATGQTAADWRPMTAAKRSTTRRTRICRRRTSVDRCGCWKSAAEAETRIVLRRTVQSPRVVATAGAPLFIATRAPSLPPTSTTRSAWIFPMVCGASSSSIGAGSVSA
jgi:hypothetical protein